jgi:pSer/pThr/pTyr-binding forkhead associated (FHA) protein
MRVQLIPVEGGAVLEVPEGLTLVGRDSSCDVQVAEGFVSKMHCVLARIAGRLLVRDLGSTNGIQVNGVRVRRAPLRGQDVLSVGRRAFRVAIGDGPPDATNLEEDERRVIAG